MSRVQVQGNPTIDKTSERLELAGAGVLGPILKGLGGKISIEIERDEILTGVRIFSNHSNKFNKQLLDQGDITDLALGRRRWDVDIEFGFDTDYGLSGGLAVRNIVEWTLLRRNVINPSGPIAGEIPLSKDDDSAMRGKSDEQLRSNRGFFVARPSMASVATDSVAAEVIEASGLAWREDASVLVVVSDDLKMAFYNRDLVSVQNVINLPGSVFNDTEAVAYLGSDRYAVLDEGSFSGGRPVRLHLFHLRDGADVVPAGDVISYTLSDIEEFSGGNGAEGLAHDRVSGKYYIGTQPTGSGQGGLWEVDIANKNTDGEPTQTLLFEWFDILVSLGHISAGALLGDLYYSHELADGQFRRSVFCHFRTPDGGGANNMRNVIQLDIDSGLVVDSFRHNLEGKWEGFTMAPGLEEMFFVREGGGANLERFEHTENELIAKFQRQFFVRDVPLSGGIFIDSQEAQLGESRVFINIGDVNTFASQATFSINILPGFSDEFFSNHEYAGNLGLPVGVNFFRNKILTTRFGERPSNRWAQTLRNIGGAKTVEVFLDADLTNPAIAEMLIENLKGYFWPAPSFGTHIITARLRAEFGSSLYIDIVGYVRFLQFECPAEE